MHTASARSLPALMYSIEAGIVSKPTCTCPARRSISAGPLPRYCLAAFNAAAKPYESVAGAPWLRRVFKNGVESVETFKRIDAGNNRFRYRWVESTPEELETGLFSKTHAEWVAASGGEVPFVRGEDAA